MQVSLYFDLTPSRLVVSESEKYFRETVDRYNFEIGITSFGSNMAGFLISKDNGENSPIYEVESPDMLTVINLFGLVDTAAVRRRITLALYRWMRFVAHCFRENGIWQLPGEYGPFEGLIIKERKKK